VICCLSVSSSCFLLLVNWVTACMLFSSSSSLSGSSSRMKRVNLRIASKTSEGTASLDLSWVARNSERVITAAQTIGEDRTLPVSSFRCTALVASSTTLNWLSFSRSRCFVCLPSSFLSSSLFLPCPSFFLLLLIPLSLRLSLSKSFFLRAAPASLSFRTSSALASFSLSSAARAASRSLCLSSP